MVCGVDKNKNGHVIQLIASGIWSMDKLEIAKYSQKSLGLLHTRHSYHAFIRMLCYFSLASGNSVAMS